MDELKQKLSELFMSSGMAHHKAYEATDGVDPEWALFYADYLQEKVNALLETELTKSELIYMLWGLSIEQPLKAPEGKWPDYYAEVFMDKYVLGEA